MNRMLHIDMDAFFAAIEERDNPSLKDVPVVIGSPPDRRGVVSTANYAARRFGIHSAMPSRTAGKLCPHAVFLPVNMAKYLQVSHQLIRILESFTPMVEQVSIDEAFLDIAGVVRGWGDGGSLAGAIKTRIRVDLGLTASVGVARNKFLAKLSSDLEKPDGLTVCPEGDAEVEAFLAPLPIRRLWGVGAVTEKRLTDHGLTTIRDVQRCDPRLLNAWLGPVLAEHLHRLAFGIDDRPVQLEQETKSISAEHTFDQDVADPEAIKACYLGLIEQVGYRLRKAGLLCRTFHFKLRFSDFQTMTRQAGSEHPTSSDRTLIHRGLGLLQAAPRDRRPVRLIGFGVSGLTEPGETLRQLDLFTRVEGGDERDRHLDQAVDALRSKYGKDAIRRGGRLV